MKRTLVLKLAAFVCFVLCAAGVMAQEVHYNYDRDATFATYQTYQWDEPATEGEDYLSDRDIRRAIEAQLSQKGLVRVKSNGDLRIAYTTAIDRMKQLDGWSTGPRWAAMGHASVSTVEVGTLVVGFYDPAAKQLVWRGSVSKSLNLSKDPDKNYEKLEKAIAKLLKDYPPRNAR